MTSRNETEDTKEDSNEVPVPVPALCNHKKRRRVSFSSQNAVKAIEKISVYEEKALYWYSGEELEMMQEDVWCATERFQKSLNINENDVVYDLYRSSCVCPGLDLDEFEVDSSSLVDPYRYSDIKRKLKILFKKSAKKSKSSSPGSASDDTSLCFRGLESLIFPAVRRNRSIFLDTMLQNQEQCRNVLESAKFKGAPGTDLDMLNSNLTRRLSLSSSTLSKWAVDVALVLAEYDTENPELYQHSSKKPKKSMVTKLRGLSAFVRNMKKKKSIKKYRSPSGRGGKVSNEFSQ